VNFKLNFKPQSSNPKLTSLHMKLLTRTLRPYAICLIMLASCSTTRIVTKYDCNTVANNPVNRKTTWTFAWGLVQPKDIDPKCEPAFNHLNKVEVKNNLGFILISAVTLGAVIPQRVQWCCAPQEIPTERIR
jgi:hypothetical protein